MPLFGFAAFEPTPERRGAGYTPSHSELASATRRTTAGNSLLSTDVIISSSAAFVGSIRTHLSAVRITLDLESRTCP
jgi:hypothetical protein